MPEPIIAPQTWPEGATPTVDQLRAWVRSHPPAPAGSSDARIAAGVILKMLAAEQRRTRDLERRVDALTDAMGRYRLAWLSARRRATEAYSDGYADGMTEA